MKKSLDEIQESVLSLLDPTLPWYSNLANVSAVLRDIGDLNWCGFYLAQDGVLYLGPFQGEPACTRIPFGKGVCGTAAMTGETVIVPDVHCFPGHIACSAVSASEIVVPICKAGKTVGVIDLDSPLPDRFDREIGTMLERIAEQLAGVFD